jgi:hypothetical protein
MGDVPSWITAIAALLGVVLGAIAVRRTRATAPANDDRLGAIEAWLRDRQEAAERADADQVCVWPVSERETFQKVIERGVVGAAVRNAAATPIYSVEVIYRDPDAAWIAVRRLPIVPPSPEPQVYAGFDEQATVGAPHPDRVNDDGTIRLALSSQMLVAIRFTDTAGRRWFRDEQGQLSRTDDESALGPAGAAAPPGIDAEVAGSR